MSVTALVDCWNEPLTGSIADCLLGFSVGVEEGNLQNAALNIQEGMPLAIC